ncbi:unnamed protein product [Absidia cylindrospora]
MTLSATRMLNPDRYSFIQIRSAKIPRTFELKTELVEQEKVTSLLEQQCLGSMD